MSTNMKIFDGTTSLCSSGHIALPLLILAGTGAAIGIAVTPSSGLLGKAIAFFEKLQSYAVLKGASNSATQDDRISELPDDLLSKILAHLDLKDALRTRILSRRWKNICKLRSDVVFDCRVMFGKVQHHQPNCFHKLMFLLAVDQSLQLFSGRKIRCLVLVSCLGKELASYFNRWMLYIVSCGVQELLLNSPICVDEYGNYCFVNPLCLPFELLFEATSLTHLHLVNCLLQPLRFKGQFNSLRFLTLIMVPLDNGEFRCILSSCVNLRWMSVTQCNLPHKLCISGPRLQLENLHIRLCPGVKEINICAGNLTFFSCYTDEKIKYSLDFVPKLELLCLNFNGSGTVPYLFGEVNCTRVKRLVFQTRTDELRCTPSKMNMFSTLRMLYLCITVEFKADLLSVASILDACPVLEKLRFLARCLSRNEQKGVAWPAMRHDHLKKLEFEGFQGTRYEIEFASYLLRSASALEELWIRSSYSSYSLDFKRTEHVGHGMNDVERKLIYKELSGQALPTKARVIFL